MAPGSSPVEAWFEEGCWISEWWNSPDDAALSVARARVPAGGTTRWHRLRDIVERYVVLEGRGVVEVGEAAPREVGRGDVVLIPAGVPQRIANRGAEDLVFLAICTPRFDRRAYEDLEPRP
jgi:mannose-6-phosphate isomerase-like protein (cupin superfamily)